MWANVPASLSWQETRPGSQWAFPFTGKCSAILHGREIPQWKGAVACTRSREGEAVSLYQLIYVARLKIVNLQISEAIWVSKSEK